MDVSAQHSFGWQLQQSQKKLVVPSLTEPPPTIEECKANGPALARIEKFYTEGEDKQGFYVKEVKREREEFLKHRERIKRQQEDLKRFDPEHPRRRGLEEELEKEARIVEIEIRARDSAEKQLQVLNQKRNELVQTMRYLGILMSSHCVNVNKK